MSEKENVIDLPLGTKEIADRLKISESAIRKYASAFEKAGHEFERSGTTRLFKPSDADMFRSIYKLTEKTKLNVDHAVAVVLTRNTQTTSSVVDKNTDISMVPDFDEQYSTELATVKNELFQQRNLTGILVDSLKEYEERSEDRQKELLARLEEQHNMNLELMNALKEEKKERQMMQEKLNVAVDFIQKQEEKTDHQKEEKKSFFKRLFGG